MEALPNDPWNAAWGDPAYTVLPPANESLDNGTDLARYFRKNSAFASYYEIQASETRWANIVNDLRLWAGRLSGDIA